MTAVLVALSSFVAVNAMARQTVNTEHTYGFRGKSVSIDLTVGEVQILPSQNDDEISVRRRVTYGLRAPVLEERIDGDTFRISDGDCAMPVWGVCHVKWLVLVPPHLPVAVTTHTGGITVRGLAGPVNLTSESGDVKARTLSGQAVQLLSHEGSVSGTDIRSSHVVATSTSGDISLTFRTAPKLVRGHTGTGSVEVILPEGDEAYKVTARVAEGQGKTITGVKQDDNANRNINVRSDTGEIRVEQGSPTPSS
ncbi:MAG TPA: DUF4097 family beta strand repeat-containing protein [Acidimicrobiia bacterium]|nr:DUF4097 family beta strand repeat-containing protein [Acidimicrobiia bacterium]